MFHFRAKLRFNPFFGAGHEAVCGASFAFARHREGLEREGSHRGTSHSSPSPSGGTHAQHTRAAPHAALG